MQADNKRLRRFLLIITIINILVFFSITQSFVPQQRIESKLLVLFSPDDKPRDYLVRYLSNAKKRIYAAIYMLTDKRIAQALIDAKDRKVDVQIITDKISWHSRFGKIKHIVENGITAFVFKTYQSAWAPIMHNKFAVIDNSLWTGSFNWTVAASTKNQENVVLTNEKEVVERFLAHFEKLKKRCEKLEI